MKPEICAECMPVGSPIKLRLPFFKVDSVKVALQRRDFRTLDDELFRVPVKTYDVLYKPGAGGELLQQFPFRIV